MRMLNIIRPLLFSLLLLMGQAIALSPQEVPKQSVNEKQLRMIERYMNSSENPCGHFYGYACGNWAKHHLNESYVETLGLVHHETTEEFVNFFEAFVPFETAHTIYDKVWTYYMSCKGQPERDLKRYLEYVSPAGSTEWPIMQKKTTVPWVKEQFDWILTVAKLRRYGLNGVLIEHLVLPTLQNASKYVIDLDKPALQPAYELPLRVVALTLFAELSVERSKAKQVAKELENFELQIEELIKANDDRGLLKVTLRNLEDDLPKISWRSYLKTILGLHVGKDYSLQIRNMGYFEKLAELMEATDPEIICNYLMFKFLYYILSNSSSSFSRNDCMIEVRSKMDLAMNYIYHDQYYRRQSEDYNAEIHRIFEILRSEFMRKIAENTLNLNIREQKFIKEKLLKMDINIGNMPKKISRDFIAQYYNDLQLELTNYNANHLKLLELHFAKEHQQLERPMTDEDFFIGNGNIGRSSTAFYLARRNLIVVPFELLKMPVYDKEMYAVFQLSLFGFILAHEMAHGFDGYGIRFDFRGNWFGVGNNIVKKSKYISSVKCLQHDGTEVVDERIADVYGIRLAYDALFGPNSTVNAANQPNFTEMSMKRLFFLNFAQFFCGSLTDKFTGHDSDNVRLQETLLNFEPFAEEFQCKVGDVMHPERKCRLW